MFLDIYYWEKTDILKTCQKSNFSERKFEEMH